MYWQLCYKRIRKFYPKNKIVIIDDNRQLSICYRNTINKYN